MLLILLASASTRSTAETARIATYNVSLYADSAGQVAERLARGVDQQAAAEAEIIQRIDPDILLLNEVDYDSGLTLVDVFQKKYLEVGQNVSQSPSGPAEPICFKYRFAAPSNTGMHSDHDLDRNGLISHQPGSRDYGSDCWGFGQYPGQYGMVVLSKYPISVDEVRTFKRFLWKHMPGARLPDDPATPELADWYSSEVLEAFPLSSKSHWDVPIKIDGKTVHVLVSHPTPPAFDGEEDRNGKRNHDEIRFWVDYVAGKQGSYIYDDDGERGGLGANKSFVIMGDLNGDPHDGQGQEGITALLASPAIASYPAPESEGGAEQAKLQGGVNATHQGNPRHDTLDAADGDGPGNLRLDYILPSKDLKVVASGVFWPQNKDTLFDLVGVFPFPSSDHRLVWADIAW